MAHIIVAEKVGPVVILGLESAQLVPVGDYIVKSGSKLFGCDFHTFHDIYQPVQQT